MYKPGQFLYQAAKEHNETGQVSRRNLVGGLVELLGGLAVSGSAVMQPRQAHAFERNPNGYPVPDLAGLNPYMTLNRDVSKDIPGEETVLTKYKLRDGTKVVKGSIEGHTYGYAVIGKTKDVSYFIMDSDGKGKFTDKYGIDEKFHVPKWLIEKAMKKVSRL